ncbi:MAG TPA: hypothetical protein VE961_25850, partial [Pyrinomonadaceae bacterium]|nr:hypothetical protein [Pyrinomonadaceae bacterium]
MAVSEENNPNQQVETARLAFEQEFEPFARFSVDDTSALGLSLQEAEAEQRSLGELRSRHTGKKSALAAAKKLIGRVAPAERAQFGQLVQQTEAKINVSIDGVEANLKSII